MSDTTTAPGSARRPRRLALPVLALAGALALAACGGGETAGAGGDKAGSSGGHGGGHSSAAGGDTAKGKGAKGSDADVAFLTGMTPHHEQAVEMSDLVLAADPPAEVAALARQIKGAQAPEIEQIDAMLADLGEAGGRHGGGHAAHGGMMSGQEMAALKAARGAEAVRLYLEGMIAHHEGAIAASDAQIADGRYEPAVRLAHEIRQAQTAEITTMRGLLTSL